MENNRITVPLFENWYDIAEEVQWSGLEAGTWHLRYDPDKRQVTLRTKHPDLTGIPEAVWHKRIRTYTVQVKQGIVDARSVTEFLESEEGQSLLQRIAGGFSIEWNGSNRVGSLTEDAHRAESRLTALLRMDTPYPLDLFGDELETIEESERVEIDEIAIDTYRDSGFWQAGMWLEGFTDEELGVRADMSKEAITALADELYEEAREEGQIVRGVHQEITDRVEEMREKRNCQQA